jgi:hypothetical protein
MSRFKEIIELAGLAVDGAGVLIIVLGMLFASVRFALPGARKVSGAYRTFREGYLASRNSSISRAVSSG